MKSAPWRGAGRLKGETGRYGCGWEEELKFGGRA